MSEAEKQTDTAPERIWISPTSFSGGGPAYIYDEQSHEPQDIPYVREDTRTRSPVAQMDWQQVTLNGGPPCFSTVLANGDRSGWYCGRAERWSGHGVLHSYVSLEQMIAATNKREYDQAIHIGLAMAEETILDFKDRMPLGTLDELLAEVAALNPKSASTPTTRAHVEGCTKALRVPVDLCECGGRVITWPSTPATGADEVAAALAELQSLFSHTAEGRIRIRRYNTWWEGGAGSVWGVSVDDLDRQGPTLTEAVAKIREWKEQQ